MESELEEETSEGSVTAAGITGSAEEETVGVDEETVGADEEKVGLVWNVVVGHNSEFDNG